MKKIYAFLILVLCGFISGQEINDSIYSKLKKLNPEEGISYLGSLCWKNREVDTELSIKYGELALKIADSLDTDFEVAKISNFLGVSHIHYKYGLTRSIEYFHRALNVGMKTRDTVQIAYAYNNLGDAFFMTGNIPLSLRYSEKSLNFFQHLKFQRGIAYSYINMAAIYRFQKDFNLALRYLKDAVKIREELKDSMGIASTYLEMALNYVESGRFDSARVYYNKSFYLQKLLNNRSYMATSLLGLGKIQFKEKRYRESLKNINEAIEIYKERDDNFRLVQAKLDRALCYSKLKELKKGEKDLNEALKISKKLGLLSRVIDTYETFAKFYLNFNDYESSTKSFEKFSHIYDSLYSVSQYEILSEIQSRFDVSVRLNQSENELELQNVQTYFLLIISFLMLIILFVLIWKNITSRRLNRELNELNKSKEKLFSIISHDLKNPFFSLMGHIDILKENNLSEEEYKSIINSLDKTTHKTYQLLENLLNLSLSRTGKIDFLPVKINLEEQVNKELDLLENQMNAKSLKTEQNLEIKEIFADLKMFEIILRNLITNAIKYSQTGGKIILSTYQKNNNIVISVKDFGTGIETEIKNNLFNTESVISQKGTSGEKGTGLGLSLCKEFMDKHKGTISVNSEVNQGSEFLIEFPCKN